MANNDQNMPPDIAAQLRKNVENMFTPPGETIATAEASVNFSDVNFSDVECPNWIPSDHPPHENDIHEIIHGGILPFILQQAGGGTTEEEVRSMADKAEARVRAFFDCFRYEVKSKEDHVSNSELMIALECVAQIMPNFRSVERIAARRGPLIVVP